MGDAGSLIETFGNLCAFGLVAWLVKHTFSKTIPRLAEDFKTMLTEQRVAAVNTINAERTAFIDETRTQRREFLEELRRINEGNRAERHECVEKLEVLKEKLDELADTVRRRFPDGGR